MMVWAMLVLVLVAGAWGYALVSLARHFWTLVSWGKIGQRVGSAESTDATALRWRSLREVLEASGESRLLLLHDFRSEVGRELQRGALLRRHAPRIMLFAGGGGFLVTWWDYRTVAWGIGALCLAFTAVCVLVCHAAERRSRAVCVQLNALIRRLSGR
jgi:hypothetical protein